MSSNNVGMTDVIAVFDIGKTNKKIMLFNHNLKVVYLKDQRFDLIKDEDGFELENIDSLVSWIKSSLDTIISEKVFSIKAVNFSTYGATLMYLDKNGDRLTPLYNYLKLLPKEISSEIHNVNGGVNEFSRATASPNLGFLNSGLQIKWLQETKPEVFGKVDNTLHFPQYLSYVFTKEITSEYTSIGCHTAMWNFDKNEYHSWLADANINLPEPVPNSTVFTEIYNGQSIKFGIGMHDSSSSLVPYLLANDNEFILISTGTWSIVMNPFNSEPLTYQELEDDCLCFLSANQKQVKSSRLYLGYIHEVNTNKLCSFFNVDSNSFKSVKMDYSIIKKLNGKFDEEKAFFKQGIPSDFLDNEVDLSQFDSFAEAYHKMMIDLIWYEIKSIENVIPESDTSNRIYISGGFASNDIYLKVLSGYFTDKSIYTSEIENASALGAATIIWDKVFTGEDHTIDLGLTLVEEAINIEEI